MPRVLRFLAFGIGRLLAAILGVIVATLLSWIAVVLGLAIWLVLAALYLISAGCLLIAAIGGIVWWTGAHNPHDARKALGFVVVAFAAVVIAKLIQRTARWLSGERTPPLHLTLRRDEDFQETPERMR